MASDTSASVAAIMRHNGTAGEPGGKKRQVMPSYSAKFNLPAHFIGGNHLAVAAPGPVKDFVASNDGHTIIEKVCILTILSISSWRQQIISSNS